MIMKYGKFKGEHLEGLFTCYKCGKKTPDVYFEKNGQTVCSNCKNDCQFDKIVIDDKEYSKEEVFEILKKHKAEEDKKYHKCYRCGKKYLDNNRFNMVVNNLEEIIPVNQSHAIGYQTTPYITGFKVLSKCGHGREIGLCDECIDELIKWINYNISIEE